jgi:hypothetical protein
MRTAERTCTDTQSSGNYSSSLYRSANLQVEERFAAIKLPVELTIEIALSDHQSPL